ncbi:Nonribosomal peptide synthase, partial [Hyphodiscus hymeniophilus]
MSLFPSLDTRPTTGEDWQSTEVLIRKSVHLDSFQKNHRLTALTVFKSAWALLLQCYTGDNSISYACLTPKPNSDSNLRSSCDGSICQIDFEPSDTVLSLMQKFQTTAAPSQNLQPPTFLVRSSIVKQSSTLSCDTAVRFRDLRQDYLNTTLGSHSILQNDDSDKASFHGIKIILDVEIGKSGTIANLQYLGSRFSTIAATNVAHTLTKIVKCILKDASAPVTSLEILSVRDSDQLRSWNADLPEKENVCVHDLVLEHVKTCPASPAIVSWDGNMTYSQLDKASASLAGHLVDLGVTSEALVPVCFNKSMWAIVTMLAILRAGGAFVPLDPTHPKDRLEGIISKVKAKLLVGSPETIDLFRDSKIKTLAVCPKLFGSFDAPRQFLPIKVKTYNIAFVLFTSGSTGNPKGIMQEHASVSTSSLAHGKAMNVKSTSRVLQYAAYTFDVSMMDIFTTLIYGGCICVPSEEDRMSNIAGIINKMEVNWALLTPSIAGLIVPEEVPCLQTLALGGEAVTRENVTRWADKVQLFNCYGPAECAACAIQLIDSCSMKAAVIGRAFGCGLCWVVCQTNHDRLMPIGAVGELLVEGPTLARSYLDDMEKTRVGFIKSPTWPAEIAGTRTRRLYKTGDLVRYNSDGSLDFVGRKDLQVKIRGQRVEISEVEHHLSIFPRLSLAVVANPKSGAYAKSLVAIIQLQQGAGDKRPEKGTFCLVEQSRLAEWPSFNVSDLASSLKSKLPSYMIPSHWFVVEKIPLSISGKIDRKAADQWLASLSRQIESAVPRDIVSQAKVSRNDIISLKISSKLTTLVNPDADKDSSKFLGRDFFLHTLGLDSIQIISLITFIKREFGVKLVVGTLLRPTATIRSVVQRIEEVQGQGSQLVAEKSADIMTEFERYKIEMVGRLWGQGSSLQNVFLTGSTGFVGSQILFELCARTEIRKIMLHVRASSAEDGLERVKKTAKLAGWWSGSFLGKLEVWTGDLSQPRLGLHQNHWDCLVGNAPLLRRIHSVIHSGATVRWDMDFSTLRAANVESTLDILKLMDETPSIQKFVYISGGYHGTVDMQRNAAKDVVIATGYAQTKYLSQLLIQEYCQSRSHRQTRVSIVKPSYIIGTIEDGIANIDDFLWRLIASCIHIGAFNEADLAGWIYISDVGHVATKIVECWDMINKTPSDPHVDITEGILVREFWSILINDFGYSLVPMKQEPWLAAIFSDIEARSESHPLWPLVDSLEKDQGRIGLTLDQMPDVGHVSSDNSRVKAAIRRNVRHLREIGFLPQQCNGQALNTRGKAKAFTRSRRVATGNGRIET